MSSRRFDDHRKTRRDPSVGPLDVVPRPGEPIDQTVKRFSKKVRRAGVIQEFLVRSHFMKPSVKRRRKRMLAKSRKN